MGMSVVISRYWSWFIDKVETAGRSPKGQVLLVLWWGFAECGNRKALRLKAQGVYSC